MFSGSPARRKAEANLVRTTALPLTLTMVNFIFRAITDGVLISDPWLKISWRMGRRSMFAVLVSDTD
jgi:hypothetical protein